MADDQQPHHDQSDSPVAPPALEPATLTGGSADLEGRDPGFETYVDADFDDTPIESAARRQDRAVARRRRRIMLWFLLGAGLLLMTFGDYPIWRTLVALIGAWLLLTIGFATLGAFVRPIPEPPPPGELRRVRLQYRCPSCGTELRLTIANDEVPEPPRHCSGDMDLVKSLED